MRPFGDLGFSRLSNSFLKCKANNLIDGVHNLLIAKQLGEGVHGVPSCQKPSAYKLTILGEQSVPHKVLGCDMMQVSFQQYFWKPLGKSNRLYRATPHTCYARILQFLKMNAGCTGKSSYYDKDVKFKKCHISKQNAQEIFEVIRKGRGVFHAFNLFWPICDDSIK